LYRIGVLLIFISGAELLSIVIFFTIRIRTEYRWYDKMEKNQVNTELYKYELGGCAYAAFGIVLINFTLLPFLVTVLKISPQL